MEQVQERREICGVKILGRRKEERKGRKGWFIKVYAEKSRKMLTRELQHSKEKEVKNDYGVKRIES